MSPNLPRLRNGSSIVQSTQARNLECLSAQYQPYIQNLPRIQLFLTFDTSPAWTSAGVSTLVSKPTSLPHTVCSSHCGRRTLSTPELGYISPLLRTFHGSRRTQRSPTLHYGPQALPAPPFPLTTLTSSLSPPSLIPVQPHWLPGYTKNSPGIVLSQNLCTCFLCLQSSPPRCSRGSTSFRPLLKQHLLGEAFFDHSKMVPSVPSPYFVPYHHLMTVTHFHIDGCLPTYPRAGIYMF